MGIEENGKGFVASAKRKSLSFPASYSGYPIDVPFSGTTQGSRVNASTQLMHNVPVSGLSGAEGSYQAFYVDVPSGATDITVTTSGGSGDVDLYLIYSQPPFWWDVSWEEANEEEVMVEGPDAGIWYVLLEGWEAYGDVTLLYTVNTSPSAVIPLPTSQQIIPYAPVAFPELYNNPPQAKPIGIGPLASGGSTLDVKIGLNPIEGAADLYVAYRMHSNPLTAYVLNPAGGFTPLSVSQILNAMATGTPLAGFDPWMSNTTGPVDVSLLSVPTSALPTNGYDAFLLMTPAGVLSNYYLWMTMFNIP